MKENVKNPDWCIANKDVKDEDGRTALFIAARDGHYESVKVLIENGADVDEKIFGRNAFDIALANHRYKITELIMRYRREKKNN